MAFRMPKAFKAFLSHFKAECSSDARLVKKELESLWPGREALIDSDNHSDLHDVRSSECVVLFQSKGVLTRPWCLIELYTAATSGVPSVCLRILGSFPYDFALAADFLAHLDSRLEGASPGATQLLLDNGVDLVDCAYRLSDAVPKAISVAFDASSTHDAINAAILDLAGSIDFAVKSPAKQPALTKDEWLACRDDQGPAVAAANEDDRELHRLSPSESA